MAKVRIYDLSKIVGVSNKELVDYIKNIKGIPIKSHSSSVDQATANEIILEFRRMKKAKKEGKKFVPRRVVKEKPEKPAETKKVPEKIEPKPELKAPVGEKPVKVEKSVEAEITTKPTKPLKQEKPEKPEKVRVPQKAESKEKVKKHVKTAKHTKPAKSVEGKQKSTHVSKEGKKQEEAKDKEKAKSKKKRRKKSKSKAKESSLKDITNIIRPKEETPPKFKETKKGKVTRKITRTQTRSFPYSKYDKRSRKKRAPEVTKKESQVKWMEIPDTITVGDLSKKLEVPTNEIIKLLMKQGIMASINQSLNFDLAASVVKKYGYRVEHKKIELPKPEEEEVDPKLLSPRPPVVTVLGHVDHGKTSLLDCIRKTNVAEQESGGITQSVGASVVEMGDRKVVFIDTPGHEAFTAMRARGAKVTDIAILVVAADDGIMPQTIEAINHARAANVPIIVAINKIDKPNANPERVKQQLAELDIIAEDWGGDTVTVTVSAKTKIGIDELLEMNLLVADMQELKANPHRKAEGTIIESSMNTGLVPVATVIIQNGTLKVGDCVIVGNEWGRIKAMLNDKGKRIKKAFPSMPAVITGLSGVPKAGDHLQVVDDDKEAKAISEKRKEDHRTKRLEAYSRTSLDDLFRQMKEGEVKDLKIILKADTQGSLEALKHSLQRLSTDEVKICIIHGGVGAISESDVMLATASDAIIIGFNVRPDPITKRLAEQEKVDVRLYRVIYHIIEDIKSAMVGLLEPEFKEVMLGRAEVRATFKISKVGVIAGCYVTEGKIMRNADARIIRDGVVIYEGKVESLRRFKDDVKEVSANFECGLSIEKFGAMQPGDVIEAYTLQEIQRELGETESKSG